MFYHSSSSSFESYCYTKQNLAERWEWMREASVVSVMAQELTCVKSWAVWKSSSSLSLSLSCESITLFFSHDPASLTFNSASPLAHTCAQEAFSPCQSLQPEGEFGSSPSQTTQRDIQVPYITARRDSVSSSRRWRQPAGTTPSANHPGCTTNVCQRWSRPVSQRESYETRAETENMC